MGAPRSERRKRRAWRAHARVIAVAIVLACATVVAGLASDDGDSTPSPPRITRPHPVSDLERKRAAATAARIEREWPLRGADDASTFVRALGQRLAEAAGPVAFRWQFTLLRDRSINAFAIGNGRVYVSDGAIARCADEAELAALLAHEMGHQLAGHFDPDPERNVWSGFWPFGSPQESAEVGIGSIRQSIDPVKERQADERSLRILGAAHYDRRAALRLAERVLREHGARAQHLDDARRTEALAALLDGVPSEGRKDSAEFARLHQRLAMDLGIAPTTAPAP